jgi:hypothetical protein
MSTLTVERLKELRQKFANHIGGFAPQNWHADILTLIDQALARSENRVSDKSLEIAVVALTYSSARMREQFKWYDLIELKEAADLQDAARQEIRESIGSPEPEVSS